MNDSRCLIIAEVGVNHNGRLDLALRHCDAAKECGADVVKFQTWKTEKLLTMKVEQAEYQISNTGKIESQFDMLKRLELSYDDFARIKKHCDDIGIMFASTADEQDSLDFLLNLGIPFIKVGSGDIGNISYLRYIGGHKKPILLSTGMSSLSDVDISINALNQGGSSNITILHCTTNYPCPYNDVNLRAMITLRDAFHLPVGYSDHTVGSEIPVSAVALGASVIEKHFTLDRNMDGPDQLASTEPSEFKKMVEQIRHIEMALGDGVKRPTIAEKEISKVVTKRIVALHAINQGEVFSTENITIKRNDTGELCCNWDRVVGKLAMRDFEKDEGIE